MVKANRRLGKPSSHTRLLSRVAVWDVVWGGLSPLAAYLLRDGAILRPNGTVTYCGVAFLTSLLVFQWFQTSSPISRFYSMRDAFELIKACALIAALSAVASFVLRSKRFAWKVTMFPSPHPAFAKHFHLPDLVFTEKEFF